jgi:hypothetical protein
MSIMRGKNTASTAINELEYDPLTQVVKVSFVRTGQVWAYHDVPYLIFDRWVCSESWGVFFNAHIKGRYNATLYEELVLRDAGKDLSGVVLRVR